MNWGIPQGTIVGPFVCVIMVNVIRSANITQIYYLLNTHMIYILCSYRINGNEDVDWIKKVAADNEMSINLSKTKGLVVRGRFEEALYLLI